MKIQNLKKQKINNFVLMIILLISIISCSSQKTQELIFKEDFDENNIKASEVKNANLINQSEFSQMIKIKDFLEQQARL